MWRDVDPVTPFAVDESGGFSLSETCRTGTKGKGTGVTEKAES